MAEIASIKKGNTISSNEDEFITVNVADIRRKSVRGGMHTVISQAVLTVVQMASTVVLARLLSPNDFGILAMVLAVTGFAKIFRDMGLSSAAIQRKRLTAQLQDNLFWLNVVAGFLLTTLIATSAPLVAGFFGEPELMLVTVALSFNFLIGGFGIQHTTRLVRDMQFGKRAVAQITGAIATLITTIVLAIKGYSYWALVWGELAGTLATTLLVFHLSPFWPGLPRRERGTMSMMRFGTNVMGSNLINYFSRNLDNILIGKFCGPLALGLYTKAYSLILLPVKSINRPISSVAYPSLCRIDRQSEDFRDYYISTARTVALLTMPLMGFLFVYSETIIRLMLGEQWLEAARIFSVLALVGFIQPTTTLRGIVILSAGSARKNLYADAITTTVVLVAFLVGVRWGPMGVATAYVVAVWGLIQPMHLFSIKDTSIRPLDFFRACRTPAGVVIGLAVAFSAGNRLISIHGFIGLAITGVVFGLIALGFFLVISDTRDLVRGFLAHLRSHDASKVAN
ncbi:MAG: lipopolysaccharide biosynthesis protein [Pseudomonas sp.]|nr:MAG: lipopolysaccharide biosynthesis protein [Pseudomonas sp.]